MESRIIGQLLAGFAVKLAGAALAIYVACEVGAYVTHVFSAVNSGLSVLG